MESILRALRSEQERVTSGGRRAFVCATWAQSLDGYISGASGVRTRISCEESMTLTHELRAAHDAILVGIGTLLADDPRLNARLPRAVKSPRPAVLDATLRTPPSSRLFSVQREQRPFVFTTRPHNGLDAWEKRRAALERVAEVVEVPRGCEVHGRSLSFEHVLNVLMQNGVKSVMIEGGSRVLTAAIDENLADFVVVTVAPTIFGGGVTALGPFNAPTQSVSVVEAPTLLEPRWTQLGTDAVLRGVPATKR